MTGDFDGTQMLALDALEIPGDHLDEAKYLLALGLEYGGQPTEAIALYDELLSTIQDDQRLNDVRFRRAEALGRAGRYEEALAQLDALGDDTRSPSDEVKVELLRGLWELELPSKESERIGLERIRNTLEGAAKIDAPSHQAMARARMAQLAAAQAKTILFKGNKKKKGLRLEARAGLVKLTSDQIVPMISLESPRSTLATFLVAGQAYEEFGQAMLEESKVRGLNKRQRPIYENERQEHVEQIWVKASRYYDRGIQYAEMVGWRGPEAEALQTALDQVVTRVDALADAGPVPGS